MKSIVRTVRGFNQAQIPHRRAIHSHDSGKIPTDSGWDVRPFDKCHWSGNKREFLSPPFVFVILFSCFCLRVAVYV